MKENRKTKCSLIQLVWLNLLSSTRHKYRGVIVQANATSVTRRLNVLILTHALTKTYNAQSIILISPLLSCTFMTTKH